MNKLSKFLVAAMAISSFLVAFSPREIASQVRGRFLSYSMLKPGDKFDGMTIATGVEHAYPLSAFCSATKENDHSIRVDCEELLVCANIAIGDTFGLTDLIPASVDQAELRWEMSVDGHALDLEAFGVTSFAYPSLAPSPSPVREVFKVSKLWDIVIINPAPGTHTLQGQAQPADGSAAYTWEVNFTVPTARGNN